MIPANDRRALSPRAAPGALFWVSCRVGHGAGSVPPFIFWSHVPNTMRPSFLNDGSVGAKGDIMIERAEEARPRSEIVWVALYSILVFLLMAAWADIPT
jgi:hypothetical protein